MSGINAGDEVRRFLNRVRYLLTRYCLPETCV